MNNNSSNAALIQEALDNAVAHHQAGRFQAAEELYKAILQIAPQHAEANHRLGLLALQFSQTAAGLHFLREALSAEPSTQQYWQSYLDALLASGEQTAADELGQLAQKHGITLTKANSTAPAVEPEPVIADKPHQAPTPPASSKLHKKLAPASEIAALKQTFQQSDFRTLEKRALAMTQKYPGTPDGWRALSVAYYRTGRTALALPAAQKLTELQPNSAVAHNNLSHMYWSSGKTELAAQSARRAIELNPKLADPHVNLGNALKETGRIDEALECYRRALTLKPDLAAALSNMGVLMIDQKHFLEAEGYLRRATELEPNSPSIRTSFATALMKLGKTAESQDNLLHAIKLDPENIKAYTFLLFALNYSNTSFSPEALSLARRYGEILHRKAGSARYSTWNCPPQPQRLKVGLVSGDFRNHPVGYFIESVLQNIDPTRIELVAYAAHPQAKYDTLTARLLQYFSAWHSLDGLDDKQAAERIHADGIHILVDLSGHTTYNRLPMFAYKAAPVQATWLAYFATTGVEEIDYLIADPNVCPPEEEHHFTETIWRLPETYMCFTPPDANVEINPPPALDNGHITFGCFNNLNKMNDTVVATWAAVLKQVPNSRLFLKATQLRENSVHDVTRERFASHGIAPERLIMEGFTSRLSYLESYRRIDIVLDPFPYPGGTTTMESLWMSVPVLTLRGNRMLSHAGENIMKNAGLPNWIATDTDDYIAKAVAFAQDIPALAALRSRLRGQVLASPMFDAPRFAQHLENAWWGMWNKNRTMPAGSSS